MSPFERTTKRIKLEPTVAIDATLDNEFLIRHILTYIGDCQYRFVAGVNRIFRKTYDSLYSSSVKTTYVNASTMKHMLFCDNEMDIDDRIMLFKSAACHGNLEVLQHLLSEHFITVLSQNYNGMDVVVKHGHLHALKWLQKNGMTMNWSYLALYAIYNGNLPILEWAHKYDSSILTARICNVAASIGHMHILEWLHSKNCPWNITTCADSAAKGQLEVLQWLRANNCAWDERTCSYAARSGYLEILKWAFKNGCAWDKQVYIGAGKNGHYNILNWAHRKGCPWDEEVCSDAARYGRFNVLRWLHSKGCPWDEKVCVEAAKNGHLEILQWAREHGCPWNGQESDANDDESLPSDNALRS